MPFEPKVAIITGAAAGIGRAIALRLAQDGLSVVVNDLPSQCERLESLVSEIEARGGAAKAVEGDVSVEENVIKVVKVCVEAFGSLDVMVANAGTGAFSPIVDSEPFKPHTSCTHRDNRVYSHLRPIDHHISANLHSTVFAYKHAGKQMIAQGRGGRIIGASSAAGKQGYPNFGAYSASKFAVRGLTQSAAQELGPHGITVNAYCPGYIETQLTDGLLDNLSTTTGAPVDALKAAFVQKAALKRSGKPEDVAGLVSFLASKDSGFITGQSVLIDGGVVFD